MRNRVRDWLWRKSTWLFVLGGKRPGLSFRRWLWRALCDMLDDLAALVEVRRW